MNVVLIIKYFSAVMQDKRKLSESHTIIFFLIFMFHFDEIYSGKSVARSARLSINSVVEFHGTVPCNKHISTSIGLTSMKFYF